MTTLTALLFESAWTVVDELEAAWARGEAVVVLDPRLPDAAQRAALAEARPHALRTERGVQALDADGELDEDAALVVLTSGSSGTPRAAEVSHAAVRAAAQRSSQRLQVDRHVDTWLACLPLAHVGGLGVVTRALLTDTPLLVHDRADPDAIEAAATTGATLVSLVPTLLRRCDTSGFRTVLVGGAAAPGALPANAVATWGMTETFGGVVYDGRPLDDVVLRVEDGELLVQSPTLARRWRDGSPILADDGWLHTGDAARLLPDGRLEVLGRLGDVINTGGEKVWPAQVEAALTTHPAVAEALVVGVADPEWGAHVHAVVVPAAPGGAPALEELRAHVRQTLPTWCAPHSLELAPALPRLPSGKVRRAGPPGPT